MTDDAPAAATPAGPPRLPPPSVSVLLINLGRRARESVEDRLREHGLGYHHLSALGHLHRQPGLSYSELARRAQVTVQSIQATVTHLEQHGLVDRGVATSRGRRADLRVTERGLQLLLAAEADIRSVDDDLLADLSGPERGQLEATLLRLFTARTRTAGEDGAAGSSPGRRG